MKLQIKTIVTSIETINLLLKEKISAVAALRVNSNIDALTPVIERYNKARAKLFDVYGTKMEDTDGISISQENIMKFNDELTDLLDEYVEVPGFEIITKVEWFENCQLTPLEMRQIDYFFKEQKIEKVEE